SMQPAIHPRDILLICRCRADDLRPHNVVLFLRDGRLIAHRLLDVGIRAGRRVLVTRGDAIWAADAPVDAGDLLGRVVAVGRRGVFRAPAACTPLARAHGLVASEYTALRVRLQQQSALYIRGASPLGLPCTRSRSPLRRLAPIAWLARCARSRCLEPDGSSAS